MIETGKQQGISDSTDPVAPVLDHDSQSRLDPLTGNWTIFAPDRAERPEEFVENKEVVNTEVECPFCPGNERATPAPVWVGRISDDDSIDVGDHQSAGDDWSVRVVPNKYPAVSRPGPATTARRSTSNFFRSSPVCGGHEVVIESRNHVQSLSDLDLAELRLVFRAFRDRLRYWRQIDGISYISAFKNVGSRAGASLRHTHSQLIATDHMPPAVSSSLQRRDRHRAASGCCLQCDLIRAELKDEKRVVWRDESLIALCPYASHLPMLIQITTLEHKACYEDLDDRLIESVSQLVSRTVSWLETLRPGTAYNFCLHTRPPGAGDPHDSFHWSIELFPRMTQVAGFEWSSHCMINPVLPEVAAARYRACVLSEDPRVML